MQTMKNQILSRIVRRGEGMGVMIFGAPPEFDGLLATISELESELNSL